MTEVLLDTVGLLALWNNSDQWHIPAKEAFAGRVVALNRKVLTTTFVLLECGNAAARHPYRAEVDLLRQQLEAENRLITPSDEDWRAAWDLYHRGDAEQAGIVDCVSFVVMRGWESGRCLRTIVIFGWPVLRHSFDSRPAGRSSASRWDRPAQNRVWRKRARVAPLEWRIRQCGRSRKSQKAHKAEGRC